MFYSYIKEGKIPELKKPDFENSCNSPSSDRGESDSALNCATHWPMAWKAQLTLSGPPISHLI
jgi:hypothetical protein